MAYTPYVWHDGSTGGTLVDASHLNRIEQGIADATIDAAWRFTCPPPTGDAATDTANLLAAISAAQAAAATLHLPPTNGVFYKMSTGISWDLTRGSLIGDGTDIDFGDLTTGPAITVTGAGTSSNGGYTAHRAATNKVAGLNVQAYAISTTVDGLYLSDAFNIDSATIENVSLNGFRDAITFGTNVWLAKFEKVNALHNSRYAVNMTVSGSNSGENIAFYNCCFGGSTAAGSATLYSPPDTNTEVRFVGCSFDYSFLQGKIEGGQLTFIACHFEDNSTGAMFVYTATVSPVSVAFRDCAWDSSATAVRFSIHEVLRGSTTGDVTVTFDGDKGGVYPNTYSTWFLEDSGNIGVASTVRNFAVHSASGSDLLLGDFYNLLTNGGFDTSTFVASPGVGGWTIPATGTWSIGPGGSPGGGLTATFASAATATAQQRIPLPSSRQPIRVAGKMRLTAYTAGNVSLAVQFYAADGVTPILGSLRIQNVLSTVNANWTVYSRRFTPPKGAAFMAVQLVAGGFAGTAIFDQIEAVPV